MIHYDSTLSGSINVSGSIILNGQQLTVSLVPIYEDTTPKVLNSTSSIQTLTVTGQNFDGTAIGYVKGNNGTRYDPTTSIRNSDVQLTLNFSGSDRLTSANEPYDIYILNGNGENIFEENVVNIDASPVWQTPAGNLGTVYATTTATASFTIQANDPDSNDTLNYFITGGALPTEFSLMSASNIAYITGSGNTIPLDIDSYNASGVVHNVTVAATDNVSTVLRTFSITKQWVNDGSIEQLAVPTAQALLDLGITTDGVYWLKPNPSIAAFQVYCDMTNFGGGWMIVSKWYQDAPYTVDEIYNANARNADSTYLLNGNQPNTKSTHSRLSRDQMNALWENSNHIARIWTTDGSNTTASPYGTYFQKKITNTSGFDFWNGHYSTRLWSDNLIQDISYIKVPGTEYKLTSWEGNGNVFTDGTYTDFNQPSFSNGPGWWDHFTVSAPNYGTIYATRHMGFYADITAGNQWLLTNNPSDSRYVGTDSNEGKRSIVYLK